ncbi:amino acid-binding protein [Prauserella marina]|uniref:ABC-type branched-chain amino acid transport system, substrate-binding protein n=1 Tax=Prauserella marina TaxID=530584 RepID=A0A222VQE0_9PSEU|nr:ABC transporter substrate-binding protein [Prauserella marina]ASR35953.1 amino acid-binding protein [Prauserella marina]PWV84116.1 ABC-type branched-subunit amino acid transport system substrate-binding protein [Prauserella marina]SDC29972.1 ABC-type branched-chain amino acid transport system, substrate-binding protein [Prauserella marina]
MSKRSRRGSAFVAVTAIAALVVTACGAGGRPGEGDGEGGGASDVGVTADTIKIGAHFPLTGVAAPGYSEIPTGTKAYFDYVNANGGVHGRKIEYVYKDDAYNPTNTSQVVNELVLQEEIFAMVGGLGTPTHSAVLDFLNSSGVPDLFVSSGSLLWNQPEKNPQTFGWQPDYEVEGKIIGQYLRDHLSEAKIGLFLQDDDFGDDGEKGVRAFVGDRIVAAERYAPGNTDVGPQIAALQASGADVVVGFNVPSYTALSQLTSMRLNYGPQWIYSNVGSDPALVGSLLNRFSEGKVTDASVLDGVITTEYLPGVEEKDNPWTRLWQRVWDEHGGQGELTNYRIYGMSEAYTFVQALQAAGPEPTRAGLVEALEKIGPELTGPALVPYRYSADSHAGLSGVKVVRIKGAGTEDLSPVLVTGNGDTEITEHTAEHAPPPPNGIPDMKPVG